LRDSGFMGMKGYTLGANHAAKGASGEREGQIMDWKRRRCLDTKKSEINPEVF